MVKSVLTVIQPHLELLNLKVQGMWEKSSRFLIRSGVTSTPHLSPHLKDRHLPKWSLGLELRPLTELHVMILYTDGHTGRTGYAHSEHKRTC